MRLHVVWTIFRKELTEALRDRMTLLVIIGIPVIIYPLIILGFAQVRVRQVTAQEARVSNVAVWGAVPETMYSVLATNALHPWSTGSEKVRDYLETRPTGKPEETKSKKEIQDMVFGAARDSISTREMDAVLVVWPGFIEAVTNDGLGQVSIFFDSVRPDSEKAKERLDDWVADFRKQVIRERESQHGLRAGFSKAIDVLSRNVASPTRRSGNVLGSVLPLLLILFAGMGALSSSVDLTAGEKERGTMQTLLCAPLTSVEIVAGKFLTVWSLNLLAALSNTVSMGLMFARISALGGEHSLGPGAYALTFLALLPVTFTMAAFFLAVAAMAKDVKEATNIISVVFLGTTMPLALAMSPGVELNVWLALTPLANLALLIKSVFIGEAKLELAFLVLTSSAAYAMLAVLFAARVFSREQVMLGGKQGFNAVFKLERKEGATPTPAFVLAAGAVLLVIAFYGSYFLQGSNTIRMVLTLQYGLILLPVLLMAGAMKFSLRETFSLRPLKAVSAGGAILLGISAWSVMLHLFRILPPPESFVKEMLKTLLPANVPLWVLLLALAITPAICEELLFRGMILSGLRSLGKWPAIIGSALLFGLMHGSIYRLLPTFFLGVLLGYVVWRTRSIFCSMIVHSVHNGVLVAMLFMGSSTVGIKDQEIAPPWPITIAGAVVLGLGFVLIAWKGKPESRAA
jgi:sodium transport system permease protein